MNLTGADTVIFYDSDWNPTMDAQAQDRCHRIGQTRDVHIYRLVSERTVEENILKKANQKRLLGDMAIEGGNFTTAFFKKSTIHDLFEDRLRLQRKTSGPVQAPKTLRTNRRRPRVWSSQRSPRLRMILISRPPNRLKQRRIRTNRTLTNRRKRINSRLWLLNLARWRDTH